MKVLQNQMSSFSNLENNLKEDLPQWPDQYRPSKE